MLQDKNPDDYVLATNTGYSVPNFLKFSFDAVNLKWEKYVEYDKRYERPTEVDALIGDFSKSEQFLGWKPSVRTPVLAKIMINAQIDIENLAINQY
jgi:GDPmannose 4,6-dehydratase